MTQWNWDRVKTYGKLQNAAGHLLRLTNTPWAPWVVIEGEDDRYRSLTVGQIVLQALQKKLEATDSPSFPVAPMVRVDTDHRTVLSEMDLSLSLNEKHYETELAQWQARLAELVRDPRFQNRALVCAFEGADAAGKGGAIRRIGAALDARQYQVIPVAAPTEEERAQPYLWRFWRQLPRRGRFALFDRSWYGRVLVERIEGLCSEADWMRAYGEINDFEHALVQHRVVLVKFWLAIGKDEQYRRFKAREQVEFKRFKITDEDWRNREKWDAYETAVCDMVDRTSTGEAPWTLVEANDKYHARIKVLRTLCEAVEVALDALPPADAGKGAKRSKGSRDAKSGRKRDRHAAGKGRRDRD